MKTGTFLLLALLLILPTTASAMWTFGADPSGCDDLDGIAPVASVAYEDDIQPLLDGCTGCHGEGGTAGLDLRADHSYDNLVGVISTSNPDRLRVDPFQPEDSSLFLAVNCENPGGPGFQMGNLALDDRALIRDWIAQGAHPEPFTPEIPDDVDLVQVFPGGTFGGALGLVNAGDGSDRLFVVRQNGTIEVFEPGGSPSDFMILPGPVNVGGEQGLLGLAFHPDFTDNGLFYVNYSAGSGHASGAATGDTVVSEFQIDDSTGLGDPDSERVLMTVFQDFANHNGGNIKFGPDGYLYIGMGDGGSGGDPCDRSQTLDPEDLVTAPANCTNNPPDTAALLGKMLRIDVDNTTPAGSNNLCAANPDGSAEYAVPDDNPFLEDDACAEVWSLGLRNPWRWSFDRLTGDLWIADVGQAEWEEINFEPTDDPGGANYGWNLCEGSYAYPAQNPPEICDFDHRFPVLEYPNTGFSGDCSVTGGYRYRGPVASLKGAYIYGDYCSGNIWFAWQTGPNEFEELEFVHNQPLGDLRSFGEDESGHVYVVDGGGIWRFDGDVPAPEVATVTPDSGPIAGGTEITVDGQHFLDGASVAVGGATCEVTSINPPDEIICITPAGNAGTVDVTVTNPDDQAGTLTDGFTYLDDPPSVAGIDPDSGPESVPTAVTITGDGFQSGLSVNLGGSNCQNIVVVDSGTIDCDVPPGTAGTVDITVTNPDGQSDTLPDAFTWIAAPVIDAVNPDSGPVSGGTAIVIDGDHFAAGASVDIGGEPCLDTVVAEPGEISCTTPPGTAGPVDVSVQNPDSQSATLPAGFVYLIEDDLIHADRFEASGNDE